MTLFHLAIWHEKFLGEIESLKLIDSTSKEHTTMHILAT